MSGKSVKAALSLAMLVVLAAPAASAPTQVNKQPLAMLDQLEPGNWDVNTREPGVPIERICLRSGHRLIQWRHPTDNCRQLVVMDQARQVSVQYTCPGKGYGRTQIRMETGKLAQVESQGIANGLPFAFAGEARRVGACGG